MKDGRIDLTKAQYPELQDIAGGLGINKGQSKDKLVTEITSAWKEADGNTGGGPEPDGNIGGGDGDTVETLREQLAAAENRAEVAEAKADDVTPESMRTQLKDAEARANTAENRVAELKASGAKVKNPTSPVEIERELRRYLKKDGGFKKDLPEASKVECRRYLKKANAMLAKGVEKRTVEDGWDITIQVPGFAQSLLNNPADKAKEARNKILEAAALINS